MGNTEFANVSLSRFRAGVLGLIRAAAYKAIKTGESEDQFLTRYTPDTQDAARSIYRQEAKGVPKLTERQRKTINRL